MSSITIPVKANHHPHIRPLNVLRDLSAVADLIELCFSPTMDRDGQCYLSAMRRANRAETDQGEGMPALGEGVSDLIEAFEEELRIHLRCKRVLEFDEERRMEL